MVAGWIIGAGGSIGSYGRNVNQTAQRGTQGAYTGSKAMIGGAQVLLPVMSFDVSKGHSLKGSKFPPVETSFSTGGKFIFHWWKDNFPLVEIRRVPNSRLTHNKKNKQKCLLIVQGPINSRQFDVRKRQWICFLISGKRPKNVGIMLEKVANYLYLSS